MSLQTKEAVLAAFAGQNETQENKTPEVKVEEVSNADENSENVEATEEEVEDSSDVTEKVDQEKRTQEALRILAILEDPNQSRHFVKALQSQLEQVPENKQAEVAKTILEELKSEISEADLFLLEPTLKIFAKLFTAKAEPLIQEITEIRAEMYKQQLNTQYEVFIASKNVSDEESALMEKLSKDYKPSSTTSLPQHLNRLLTLAKAELSQKAAKETTKQKATANKAETKQNSATPVSANKENVDVMRSIKTTKDAVRLAYDQLMNKG